MDKTQPDKPIRQDRASLYHYANGESFREHTLNEVFSTIFHANIWDGKNPGSSVSGSGSSALQTQHILHSLPALLDDYHIHTLLDAPCGDANWIQQLDWHTRKYIGADIVESLIARNKTTYKRDHVAFVQMNLLTDVLPDADLMFCRNCLVHFSFEDIKRTIDNIKASNINYLLTTTFPEQTLHEDIVTGGWRPINMQEPPLSFPQPLAVLNKNCTKMDGAFRDKSLGL